MFEKENDDDDDDDDEQLQNNTFLINLTNENIKTAKNNLENIILPSEYWDDEISTETTIPLETQPWFNEVEINIDDINLNNTEKLTDKQLTQNDLVNGKITISSIMVDSQNKDGISKDSTLIPRLTTVTNKRLNKANVTVSDIIDDTTSLGLSRNSTLFLDPPVNYGFVNIYDNGQYLPNEFNSSGNYDPTHSARWDYINQINVNVTIKISKYFKIVNENTGTYSSYFQLTKYSQTTTHTFRSGYGYVFITEGIDYMSINYRNYVQTSSTITLNNTHWFAEITGYNNLYALLLYKNNNTDTPNEKFLSLRDAGDNLTSYTTIYNTNITIL